MSATDLTPAAERERTALRWDTLETPVLYGAAAVSYISIGVLVTEFMLSWVVAFSWLLLWTWLLPSAIRRIASVLR